MTVNVLVFVLRVVLFHVIVYIVTRYMYDADAVIGVKTHLSVSVELR